MASPRAAIAGRLLLTGECKTAKEAKLRAGYSPSASNTIPVVRDLLRAAESVATRRGPSPYEIAQESAVKILKDPDHPNHVAMVALYVRHAPEQLPDAIEDATGKWRTALHRYALRLLIRAGNVESRDHIIQALQQRLGIKPIPLDVVLSDETGQEPASHNHEQPAEVIDVKEIVDDSSS